MLAKLNTLSSCTWFWSVSGSLNRSLVSDLEQESCAEGGVGPRGTLADTTGVPWGRACCSAAGSSQRRPHSEGVSGPQRGPVNQVLFVPRQWENHKTPIKMHRQKMLTAQPTHVSAPALSPSSVGTRAHAHGGPERRKDFTAPVDGFSRIAPGLLLGPARGQCCPEQGQGSPGRLGIL